MKNKPITYLLVLAALSIWAYVFYSIFSGVSSDDDYIIKQSNKTQQEDTSDIAISKYSLLLNYSDPFLKNYSPSHNSSSSSISNPNKTVSKPIIKENIKQLEDKNRLAADITFCKSVLYSGMIRNNTSKKNVAILTIENNEYMLSIGESANGITLLKIVADSIEVKCKERKMYIRKGM